MKFSENIKKYKFYENLTFLENYIVLSNSHYINFFEQKKYLKGVEKDNLDYVEKDNLDYVEKDNFNIKESFIKNEKFLFSISLNFKPNQIDFKLEDYEKEFENIKNICDLFPYNTVAVVGHSDPYKVFSSFISSSLEKKYIRFSGEKDHKYYVNNKEINIRDMKEIVALVEKFDFSHLSKDKNPNRLLLSANNLSLERAQKIHSLFLSYSGLQIEKFKVEGRGITEPINVLPKSLEEACKNMRVEFKFYK